MRYLNVHFKYLKNLNYKNKSQNSLKHFNKETFNKMQSNFSKNKLNILVDDKI